MPRTRGGFKTRRRRKKLLQKAKGYKGAGSRLFRIASVAVDKALLHAYNDRKLKKREYRSLWIVRINAAARAVGLTYGQLINGLKKADIGLNRKAIADMAYHDPNAFRALTDTVKNSLAS
jgi:large subunit ribosomal protein L20